MNMSVKIIWAIGILTVGGTACAEASSVTCPDMPVNLLTENSRGKKAGQIYGIKTRDTVFNDIYCPYEGDNQLNLAWNRWDFNKESLRRRCDLSGLTRYGDTMAVSYDAADREILLKYLTRMASVKVTLSPREYRPERRQMWVEAAADLLAEQHWRGGDCPENAVDVKPDQNPKPRRQSAPGVRSKTPVLPRPAPTPAKKEGAPFPIQQPDKVDQEINDILERLKGE